ncbi:MAG: histidine phosphatase family protein [Chlamydiales bacterium]|nr:histidine phosphatase family protein [Chlamydiales bacterium]
MATKINLSKWLICLFLSSTTTLFSMPSQVILIRHAEKTNSENYLSLKGRQRAAALVPTFLGLPPLLHYGPPAAIYVMKSGLKKPSIRWAQTVMGLANELGISLNNQYNRRETEQIVQEIRQTEEYEGKMILICWSHGELPKLAAQFGAKKAPKKWPKDVFDRFWILNFEDDGTVTFKDLPQKLLYGDSAK